MELEVELRPEGPAFVEVPIDLPDGVRCLEVSYYAEGQARVDIGLGGPELTDYPSLRGFRGWSGAAREEFYVATSSATPGYLAGPLEAGRWKILLGRYQVSEPTTVHLSIRASDEDRRRLGSQSPDLDNPRRGPGWLKGDLHCHTHHSDALGSLDELLQMARQKQLDFLAVTDHNTIAHHLEMRGDWGLTLILGQEVTTYKGHFNALGTGQWIDFRFDDLEGLKQALASARQGGALRVVNHPKPIHDDWKYDYWDDVDCIEVWNLPWATRNWVSLELWHKLLCAGRRLPAVGGSDRHQPPLPDPDHPLLQLGGPTTWVYAQSNAEADILAALKAGGASISEGPNGPMAYFEHEGKVVTGQTLPGGTPLEIKLIGAGECQLRVVDSQGVVMQGKAQDQPFVLRGQDFVRLELFIPVAEDHAYSGLVRQYHATTGLPFGMTPEEILAHDRILGLSNPVYIE
ncbi:MAG: CehA/McbA family metallohydrolase [Vulcanimicrobiota bacterium]